MDDEDRLRKGTVLLGELRYAGKSQLDLDPLIDRAGEDAVALSVYSTRLHFYISSESSIVADVEEVRMTSSFSANSSSPFVGRSAHSLPYLLAT